MAGYPVSLLLTHGAQYTGLYFTSQWNVIGLAFVFSALLAALNFWMVVERKDSELKIKTS